MEQPQMKQKELDQFLTLIYGNEVGYSYVATKTPPRPDRSIQDLKWDQHFFEWPKQKEELLNCIESYAGSKEVYYSPSLFSAPEAKKEHVMGARVFWCEFDGTLPTELGSIPEPSIKVSSSINGHEHWYWRLDSLQGAETLEDINRRITYALGADSSGWDAGQVLRPINTTNHKRGAKVTLRSVVADTFTPANFQGIPEPPPVPELPEIDSIPAIEDVIPKYIFPEEVWTLFKEGFPEEGKRSDGLMALGYYFAEMQLLNDEMFALLLNADERWGKFAGRSDQHKRLMEIVVRARVKYPFNGGADSEAFESVGFSSVLATEVEIDWVWEGLLHTKGYMLVTGPSGVGKTQFALHAAAKMVLQQDYMGRSTKSARPQKIGVFSLEMGLVELKAFLALQAQSYTKEELVILEENLRFFALGEPIYLTKDSEKRKIERVVEQEGLTGLIFDSLGSVTEESLSNEENVKNLMDWNDRVRQQLDIFTWYIHHHRKASGENKKPNKLGDVYGSQYITARTSTVLCLWDTGIKDTVQCIPLKTRFAEKPQPFNMHRDKHLTFYPKVSGITIVPEGESSDEVAEKELKPLTEPQAPGDNMSTF